MILIEGFDHITSSASHLANKWRNASVNLVTFSSTTPHGAGKSMLIDSFSELAQVKPSDIYYSASASYPQGTIGFHIRIDQVVYDYSYPVLQLIDASDQVQMGLYFSEEGRVQWARGTTPIYQSKGYRLNHQYSSQGEWIYIEVKYSISDSVSAGSCTVTIDGYTVLTLPAGADTKAQSTNAVAAIQFKSALAKNRYIDNLYWTASTSTLNNGGGVYVQTMYASGDFTNNWLAYPGAGGAGYHYQEVDDTTPDDDSSYVYSSVTDNRETFAFGKIQQYDGFPYDCETSPYIAAIQLVSRVKREAGDDEGHFKHIIEDGGSIWNYEPTDTGHVTTDYQYFMSISTVCPSNASAWTRDTMNSHYFGIERGDYLV